MTSLKRLPTGHSLPQGNFFSPGFSGLYVRLDGVVLEKATVWSVFRPCSPSHFAVFVSPPLFLLFLIILSAQQSTIVATYVRLRLHFNGVIIKKGQFFRGIDFCACVLSAFDVPGFSV